MIESFEDFLPHFQDALDHQWLDRSIINFRFQIVNAIFYIYAHPLVVPQFEHL